ncbi:urease accessory protein UreF [Betaproteobacteria bacterium]|nr:urease accessory protein UreF [Betaproteobacteria bacterium]GHU16147.1 urease accessory protein UreF [Betaproteobacteria bacterium]
MENILQLMRLLQLASPALPVGAFSYSQGLEWAVEREQVQDAASAAAWIGDALRFSAAACEAPALVALMRAWRAHDFEQVAPLNERFIAMRETAELRAETLQMGHSLTRLLREVEDIPPALKNALGGFAEIAFPAAWAAAAAHWGLEDAMATQGYLWAWLENQVMAAVKLVPLGQTAGQKILLEISAAIPALADSALAHADGDWQNFAPGLAHASGQHETQYTRLFRS